jgi:hypothetical protein
MYIIEYRGECPSTAALNVWRIRVIDAVAETVSKAMNVSKAEATLSVTIYTYPQTNKVLLCSYGHFIPV